MNCNDVWNNRKFSLRNSFIAATACFERLHSGMAAGKITDVYSVSFCLNKFKDQFQYGYNNLQPKLQGLEGAWSPAKLVQLK